MREVYAATRALRILSVCFSFKPAGNDLLHGLQRSANAVYQLFIMLSILVAPFKGK